jgi:hypothetical protein
MSTEEVEQDGIGAAAEEAASDTDTTSILWRSWLRPEHADLHDDALRCMDMMAFSFRMGAESDIHTKTVEAAWGQMPPEMSEAITVFRLTGLPSCSQPMRHLHGVYPASWTAPRYTQVRSSDGKAGVLSLTSGDWKAWDQLLPTEE